MLIKFAIRAFIVGALLTVLSSCVPRTVHLVYPTTEGCGAGCDFVAGGWPFVYIVDSFGTSPAGSVDLLGATLGGTDILWWDGLLSTFLFWACVPAIAMFMRGSFLVRHRTTARPTALRNQTASGTPERNPSRPVTGQRKRRSVVSVVGAYVTLGPAVAWVAFLVGVWFLPGRLPAAGVLGILIGAYLVGALPFAFAGWVHRATASANLKPWAIAASSVTAGVCSTGLAWVTSTSGPSALPMLSAATGLLATAIWLLQDGASPWD